MKVVYIAGWQRSGTTILANVLGEQPCFLAGGEISFAWESGVQGRLCGCGRLVSECEIWGAVLARVARECGVSDMGDVVALQRRIVRPRHTATLAAPVLRRRHEADLERYAELLGSIYRNLAEVSGASVIVDSSKHPNAVLALERMVGITPYYVHVVRNPSCVAESERESPEWRGDVERDRPPVRTPLASASLWLATNLAVELWRRRPGVWVPTRYEDWASDPRSATQRLVEAVGERFDPAAFASNDAATLQRNHTLAGNPARFRTGRVEIRTGNGTRPALSRRDRMTVQLVTRPLSRRYGYV